MDTLLAAAAPLMAAAFTLWGAAVTWLEIVAVVLALAMVVCNIRVIHWGWPLAAASALLYFLLFWQHRLYGDAGLQIFFATVALWGWWQWLRGRRADGSRLDVRHLGGWGRVGALLAVALTWPLLGWWLDLHTDTDVPYWDAFPTVASVVAQILLARKFVENWPTWLVVNLVALALFVHKALWLTAALYAVFAVGSLVGWRAWHRRAVEAPTPT
ncbi:MAG: nicotinamide riboside transporter PnuC [Caldimonas sp.]|uniref:nicotinamide riboside transporter PnuC n=1 Tax=Caldimonas sp. TaxID=2838790 RepID=UPI00391DBEAA